MYKIILLLILTTILSANNPKAFSALGDVIYNNVDKINSLKKLSSYQLYSKDISKYVKDVQKTKQDGFDLDRRKKSVDKKVYLTKLRKLAIQNDYFLRTIYTNYELSMQENNFELFSKMINSGLINTKEHKNEIIDYYYLHKDDINASGVIEDFLEEDARLKALKEAQRKKYKSKKELEREKIERIRENDRKKQAQLEYELQKNLEKRKKEIRENQKKELAK